MNSKTAKLLRRYATERAATEQGDSSRLYRRVKRAWTKIPWNRRAKNRRIAERYIRSSAAERNAMTRKGKEDADS